MERLKYPRTYHLPWSPGRSDDDKVLTDLSFFEDKEIVVTEKMDGENTIIYSDGYTHARSIDSGSHESRSYIRQLASELAWKIQQMSQNDWRITGENLYAKHSIHYTNLTSYFYVFGVWLSNICVSWDDTIRIANKLELTMVPELYRGPFDVTVLKSIESQLAANQEGFVMRTTEEIFFSNWSFSVAKWVRPNHVQTDEHWMNQKIIKNSLRG